MSRYQPGDLVFESHGIKVSYSPTQGNSERYRVRCPHGESYGARTQADAREMVADLIAGDCRECYEARYGEPLGAGADPYGRPDPQTHPEYWTE